MELSLLRFSNYHVHAFAKILAKEICDILNDSSVGKESACNAGDPSLIPGLGRSPQEGDRLPTPAFLGFLVPQLVKNTPEMRIFLYPVIC